MISYIQDILFQPNNINKENPLDDIYDLMFTLSYKKKRRKLINVILETHSINEIKKIETEVEIEKKDEYSLPCQKDTLFWCCYIAKHGYDEYKQIRNNYGTKQMEIQEKISKYIKENSFLLKNVNMRITKVMIQEILSELLTNTKNTEYSVLYAYVIYYQINLILLHDNEKSYLKILCQEDINDDIPLYVFKRQNGTFSVNENSLDKESYTKLTEKKHCIYNINRPLKPISNYKVQELYDLAFKIQLEFTEIKLSKVQLYDNLTKELTWD